VSKAGLTRLMILFPGNPAFKVRLSEGSRAYTNYRVKPSLGAIAKDIDLNLVLTADYHLYIICTMSEQLQQLILDTLDSQTTIHDTRSLVLPGQAAPASTSEDQIIILGALNSLLSRDVNAYFHKFL